MREIIEKLISLLNEILTKLDRDEPERERPESVPGESVQKVVKLPKPKYKIPEIIYHDVKVKVRGKYIGGRARGLVVHFTAGWNIKGAESAVNTLKDMAKRGLGCMVMDTNGVIHVAKNQDLETDYAYHAGPSEWLGLKSVSKYFMGMEICNGGRLDASGKTWFGHRPKNTRTVSRRHNMKAGTYEAFTSKQEESLKNFCLWQLDVNPDFKTWFIAGHDEVCVPDGRKGDPGGSFSKTMPEFRKELRHINGPED